MADHVLEWAPFRLKADFEEPALLAASERMQREFFSRQKGFVRRELIKGAERDYIDLLWWESFPAAQVAMKNAAHSAACQAYFAMMDNANGSPGDYVQLYEVMGTYRGGNGRSCHDADGLAKTVPIALRIA